MKGYAIGFALFTGGTALGIAGSQLLFAQSSSSGYSTKMLLRADLKDIPGEEALIFTSDWPPGSALPMHIHPDGHEFVYVVEGEQTFHFQGGGVKTVKAGEVLYTPPNTPHFGQNATGALSKTIVFRIKPKAAAMMVEVNK